MSLRCRVFILLALSSNGVLPASGLSQPIWCIHDVLVRLYGPSSLHFPASVGGHKSIHGCRTLKCVGSLGQMHKRLCFVDYSSYRTLLTPPSFPLDDALKVNTAHNFSYTETRYTFARPLRCTNFSCCASKQTDPGTFRLVAQRLNHNATTGPNLLGYVCKIRQIGIWNIKMLYENVRNGKLHDSAGK